MDWVSSVEALTGCAVNGKGGKSDLERLRLLRRMRMRRAGVALELLDHRVAERALGQHPLDGLFEHPSGETRLHLPERRRGDPARVAAVPVIELGVDLGAGHADLVDVGD